MSNILEYIANKGGIEIAPPVLCKVGGWEIQARPGDAYTFGQGNVVFGPVRLDDVQEGYDVDGIAYAVPVK